MGNLLPSESSGGFVVLGEGLAAGMGDFSLTAETQRTAFPSLIAKQMGVEFRQALLEPPGIADAPGFATLPVRIPAPMQSRVLMEMPPAPVDNIAFPGMTASATLNLKVRQPIIHRRDPNQTAFNLIVGLDSLVRGEGGLSPLDYAVARHPSLALVELGYREAIEAAVMGDPKLLPETESWEASLKQIFGALRANGATLLVLTVPDPFDTAYFSSLQAAANIVKVDPDVLNDAYGFDQDCRITVNGLMEIGCHFFERAIGALPPRTVIKAAAAAQVSSRVKEWNTRLAKAADSSSALVFDLHALFARIRRDGLRVAGRTLTADYLGGFYQLNGYYPGVTGQAMIADAILQFLNEKRGTAYPRIDIASMLAIDAATDCRPAGGPNWTVADVPQPLPRSRSQPQQPTLPAVDSTTSNHNRLAHDPLTPLSLPPSFEQVLPLSTAASYFGDGIGAFNCRTERDIQWGSSASLIFGGLAMVDSHLSGSIRLRFSPPVNGVTRFEAFYLGGFTGNDATLVTPQLFRMPFQHNRVDEVPGMVSSGKLNLATGEVTDLQFFAQYSSTALLALVGVNPHFPKTPLSFPGPYGSAWARFDRRPDGLLDFTFYGSAYVPLGKETRWPLPFAGPSMQFATIPAQGTVMHPHLQLSTKEPDSLLGDCPEIPFNTVQEFTLHTHNSAFGDQFTLNSGELGGPAKGRSHVMGRLQIQFGARTGDSVPVAITGLNPGGLFMDMPESPITQAFPGRLSPGPQGYYELLRFPLRTYSLDDLAIIDDPFDISIGLIDLKTGRLRNQLLHRGFIHQDLIFALLRVEPRTPKDSFYFRGPAVLEKGPDGRPVFRFDGIVRVPYPAGFSFPQPNLTTGYVVGPDSVLDPFLWFQAMDDGPSESETILEGGERGVIASTGDRFSYRYVIPSNGYRSEPTFEYENHSQRGSFRMHSLAWRSFTNSRRAARPARGFDTVTFTCFGIWSKDGTETIQQAAVQICTSEPRYIGIQVSSGDVSNVNTKPEDEAQALP